MATKKERIKLVSIEDTTNSYREYESGSIEQQLDMCESGPLRGDQILHQHGIDQPKNPHPSMNERQMETNFQVDMSEENREGAEETGDEHSMGLQGEELQEIKESPNLIDFQADLPGENINDSILPTRRKLQRRRAA